MLYVNGYPEPWLIIDEEKENIVLIDPEETKYVGNYRAELKLMYPQARGVESSSE